MASNLEKLTCPHSETTPEDGEGNAICLRCGAVIAVRLTLEKLERAWRSVEGERE